MRMRAYADAACSIGDRDRLIAEHLPMAERIALRIARRRPPGLGSDDLVAAAYLGLTQAADRYDASRSEPFVAFAEKRIRGAVYDELRKGDILSRRQRVKAKEVKDCMVRLRHALGREPSDEEVARELGVSVAVYHDELESLAHAAVLELPVQPERADAVIGTSAPASEAVDTVLLVRHVTAALRHLEERDALLLSLHYLEELTYAEIGEVLGVTESRVCQLHARAIARLRARLEDEPGAANANTEGKQVA